MSTSYNSARGRQARDFVRHYYRKNAYLPTRGMVEQGTSPRLEPGELCQLIEAGELVELPLYEGGEKVQISCPASTAHENEGLAHHLEDWKPPCPKCGGLEQKTSAPPVCASCGYRWPGGAFGKTGGSGDFSIGSKVWPGTSKVIEEMGELQQVLGKLIAVAGDTQHWDGDLRKRLIEEIGDLSAALDFFETENFTPQEALQISERIANKKQLFHQWHANPSKPT